MKKNELKKIKVNSFGITLIALVITIIVLLILAGVTIATLTGENGILSKTGESNIETEKGKEKEQLSLSMTNMKLENEEDDEKKEILFQGHMDEYTGEGKTKAYYIGDGYTVHFFESNRVYTIEESGEIIEENENIIKEDPVAGAFDGKGTSAEPYIIMSVEDFVFLANQVNSGKTSYSYCYIAIGKTLNFKSKLSYKNADAKYRYDEETNSYIADESATTTIKELCTTGRGFIPIGNANKYFAGTFLGKSEEGYKIENIYENNEGHAGLFGRMDSGGNAKNLIITGKINSTGDYCGAIAARGGSCANCKNYCEISSTGQYVGGLVGYMGYVTNCENYGNISTEGGHVGGICGRGGKYVNSINYASIKAKGDYTGGICGSHSQNTEGCKNYGTIESEANYVGGINGDGVVKKCTNYGSVKGKSMVGGIVGWSGAQNCCNFGSVTASVNGTGGISGVITNDIATINCYNFGTVKAEKNIGEIVGDCKYANNNNSTYSKIINCYGIGELIANSNVGGIIGTKSGYGTHYIDYCYYPKDYGVEVAGKVTAGTLTITNCEDQYNLEEMKTQEYLNTLNNYVDTYNQGDKAETSGEELLRWVQDEESGYPRLDY